MAIYYVDQKNGSIANDGLSTATPKPCVADIEKLLCGDTVLIKRGSFFRSDLPTVEGVTYAAYGEGELGL